MRLIKRYVRGDDVRQVKDKLVELGYLEKATHDRFGNDSYRAVKKYQQEHGLEADGIVGPLTWASLFGDEPVPDVPLPEHIKEPLASVLKKELAGVSKERRELCLLALTYATDANNADYPRGFYIRGANLFDTDLSLHEMTSARFSSYFRKTAYEPYYNNGRKEMMLLYAMAHDYKIPGADCSGFIVGLWRKHGIVKTGFDTTANSLYNSYCTKTDNPTPGDLCWKSGHIGLYVGGGYAVEAAGGAYGIQIATATGKRKLYNFVSKKIDKLTGWTAYGDPKYY